MDRKDRAAGEGEEGNGQAELLQNTDRLFFEKYLRGKDSSLHTHKNGEKIISSTSVTISVNYQR